VDMTYLVTRAFLGPQDIDKAVHAFLCVLRSRSFSP
jgi:hypothetical protein